MKAMKGYAKAELIAQMKCIADEIQHFKAHLQSPKFVGVEHVTKRCALCDNALIFQERKDWISTGDVDRWLSSLQALIGVSK